MIAPSLAGRGNRGREIAVFTLMCIAVIAVVWPNIPPGDLQLASDFSMLHQRRMTFARDALLGPAHVLPAWYPRELLGTPFWSNVQNFPFLPTRLLILMLFDPQWRYTFAVAVTLAAILTALFTYLFCRRIGLETIASATGGWTFACSGFFVSRIAAGHLPLLEVFWGLPLLLWIVESLAQARKKTSWLFALAISCMMLSLAGHPQLPFYAMACAGFYVIWRCGIRGALLPLIAMALGVGCAGFALVPMVLLIGRSTRVLPLAAASNDLAMPYRRLLGFFLPWADGAGSPLDHRGLPPFHGIQNYFWDTFCYIGWMPWLALLILWGVKSKKPAISRSVGRFLIAMGVLGVVLSLPFVKQLTAQIPGTLLRSPVRVIYLTEFSLAIALAAAIDRLLTIAPRRFAWMIAAVVLIAHAADLGWHDRYFIWSMTDMTTQASGDELTNFLRKNVGDGRVAIDYDLGTLANRSIDDIGFFDSIMLARPYRWLLEMSDMPLDTNVQLLSGGQLPKAALEAAGVKAIVTQFSRSDHLPLLRSSPLVKIYAVPLADRRADFFDEQEIIYPQPGEMHHMLQGAMVRLAHVLLLPPEAKSALSSASSDPSQSLHVEYRRPDSDHIQCSLTTPRAGFLRLIESWDPGWSASVDGKRAPVFAAMDALLAVPISPGRHEVRFVYHTPGADAGICISILSAVLLAIFLFPRKNKLGSR